MQDPPPPYVDSVLKQMSEVDDSYTVEDSEYVKSRRLDLSIQAKTYQIVVKEDARNRSALELAKFLAEHPEVHEPLMALGKCKTQNFMKSTSQIENDSATALRFVREKCVYDNGSRTKSGVFIQAFIDWSHENKIVLTSTASNVISPLLQKAMKKFDERIKFNATCSFTCNGKRTQSPGFIGARVCL
jgi:hypothetical protein